MSRNIHHDLEVVRPLPLCGVNGNHVGSSNESLLHFPTMKYHWRLLGSLHLSNSHPTPSNKDPTSQPVCQLRPKEKSGSLVGTWQ